MFMTAKNFNTGDDGVGCVIRPVSSIVPFTFNPDDFGGAPILYWNPEQETGAAGSTITSIADRRGAYTVTAGDNDEATLDIRSGRKHYDFGAESRFTLGSADVLDRRAFSLTMAFIYLGGDPTDAVFSVDGFSGFQFFIRDFGNGDMRAAYQGVIGSDFDGDNLDPDTFHVITFVVDLDNPPLGRAEIWIDGVNQENRMPTIPVGNIYPSGFLEFGTTISGGLIEHYQLFVHGTALAGAIVGDLHTAIRTQYTALIT